jgi:hypothetical protein
VFGPVHAATIDKPPKSASRTDNRRPMDARPPRGGAFSIDEVFPQDCG